jgi:hypothetical protein
MNSVISSNSENGLESLVEKLNDEQINSLVLYGLEINIESELIEEKIITPKLLGETFNLILNNLDVEDIDFSNDSDFYFEKELKEWNFDENIEDELYESLPENIKLIFKKDELYNYYKLWEQKFRSKGYQSIINTLIKLSENAEDFEMTKILFVDLFNYFLIFYNKKEGREIEIVKSDTDNNFKGGIGPSFLSFIAVIGIFIILNINVATAFSPNANLAQNQMGHINKQMGNRQMGNRQLGIKQTGIIPGRKTFSNLLVSGIESIDNNDPNFQIIASAAKYIVQSSTDDKELNDKLELIKKISNMGFSLTHNDFFKNIQNTLDFVQTKIKKSNRGVGRPLYSVTTALLNKFIRPKVQKKLLEQKQISDREWKEQEFANSLLSSGGNTLKHKKKVNKKQKTKKQNKKLNKKLKNKTKKSKK